MATTRHHEWIYPTGPYPRQCRHCLKTEDEIPAGMYQTLGVCLGIQPPQPTQFAQAIREQAASQNQLASAPVERTAATVATRIAELLAHPTEREMVARLLIELVARMRTEGRT